MAYPSAAMVAKINSNLSYNTEGAAAESTSSFPRHGRAPNIILPDDYSERFAKRLRVAGDGSYSPCPSPNGSAFYSPSPEHLSSDSPTPDSPLLSSERTSALSTQCSTFFSPQSPPQQPIKTEPNIPGPNNKASDSRSILHGLMANLSTVFSNRGLKEVDQELCFGMILGTIISTDENLCLLQNHHANNTCKSQFLSLNLKADSTSTSNDMQVTIDIPPKISVLGYLESSLSVVLLPLLNPPLVRIQALTLSPFVKPTERQRKRRAQAQNINILMNIYGSSINKSRVGCFLSKNKVFLQHPKFPEPGRLYCNPHLLSRPGARVLVTESTITGGVSQVRNITGPTEVEIPTSTTSLSRVFDELCESRSLGELTGDYRLTTPLLEHQKQGLYFLDKRERSISKQDSSTFRRNCSTRGGILADYMGLGKTLTILSLIVRSLDEARSVTPSSHLLSTHINTPRGLIPSGATLLIAPVSTLGNWEDQIAAHVQPNTLKYFVYYGKDRPTDPRILSKYDIVFTSFQTATQEWKVAQNSSCSSPLYAVNWFRLVLDEAHVIRTQKTMQCQAVCAISAERRWCLTGTPLQNDITDLATLFKFLNCGPLNTKENFDRYVTAKIKVGDNSGMENLRAVLKLICLRRTKDTISGRLPTQSENIKFLEFSNDERMLYESYKQKFDPTHTSKANTLQVLFNLRLICDHGKDLLSQGELELFCSVCHIQLNDWEMGVKGQMPCVHRVTCQSCIDNLAITDDKDILESGCELCSGSRETLGHYLWAGFPSYRGPSTKVKALIESIKTCTSRDLENSLSHSKHVVFSSWTRMLDLVGIAFKCNGISFCRLDGSMSRSQRNQAIAEFSTNPQTVVILVSLMAGGVGINLTCASRVHILEPHWNPMVEQQAVERVHRLGQLRDVAVTRYIMKDSFEINMIGYQKKKLELARQSLDSTKPLTVTRIIEDGSQSSFLANVLQWEA